MARVDLDALFGVFAFEGNIYAHCFADALFEVIAFDDNLTQAMVDFCKVLVVTSRPGLRNTGLESYMRDIYVRSRSKMDFKMG